VATFFGESISPLQDEVAQKEKEYQALIDELNPSSGDDGSEEEEYLSLSEEYVSYIKMSLETFLEDLNHIDSTHQLSNILSIKKRIYELSILALEKYKAGKGVLTESDLNQYPFLTVLKRDVAILGSQELKNSLNDLLDTLIEDPNKVPNPEDSTHFETEPSIGSGHREPRYRTSLNTYWQSPETIERDLETTLLVLERLSNHLNDAGLTAYIIYARQEQKNGKGDESRLNTLLMTNLCILNYFEKVKITLLSNKLGLEELLEIMGIATEYKNNIAQLYPMQKTHPGYKAAVGLTGSFTTIGIGCIPVALFLASNPIGWTIGASVASGALLTLTVMAIVFLLKHRTQLETSHKSLINSKTSFSKEQVPLEMKEALKTADLSPYTLQAEPTDYPYPRG